MKNLSFHIGIKRSPYEAMFGTPPRVGLEQTSLLREIWSQLENKDLMQPLEGLSGLHFNSADSEDETQSITQLTDMTVTKVHLWMDNLLLRKCWIQRNEQLQRNRQKQRWCYYSKQREWRKTPMLVFQYQKLMLPYGYRFSTWTVQKSVQGTCMWDVGLLTQNSCLIYWFSLLFETGQF